jgi:hypothetical protein
VKGRKVLVIPRFSNFGKPLSSKMQNTSAIENNGVFILVLSLILSIHNQIIYP